jgi:hypothetical protein
MNLKLRWARFFTLAGWNWRLSRNRSFDFLVEWPGVDDDDRTTHYLHVRICEKTRDALEAKHDDLWGVHYMYSNPHPALFGDGPDNTHWQMTWGSGGGSYSLGGYCGHYGPHHLTMQELWERAAHD